MDFAYALQEWSRLLGEENVVAFGSALARLARSTAPTAVAPRAILRPASRDELIALVQIAARARVPLHPISRGRNWGYGDANPPSAGQVVVDLGRMNRVIEINRELAYAVVEPGVTQGQLWRELQGTGLWMDSTGAGPEASLVGNALERGFGHTRYGDHFQTFCGLEVVLADGRVLETGFGHFPGAKTGAVFRYGVGPVLDGIFSQSNFGIVTRMGLWLMPEPESFTAFFFSAQGDGELAAIIDRLAPLKRQGLLPSAVHVANDLRALSARMQYPWERAGGVTPLPRALRQELRAETGVGAWNGCGAILGPRRVVAAARGEIHRALKPWFHVFLDDRRLARADRLVAWLERVGLGRRLRTRLELAKPVFDMLKGIPTDDAIRGTGWRVRQALPARADNPLDLGAGLLWVSPIAPLTGRDAAAVMAILEPIYARHGFDCLATLTLLTERTLSCVTNLAFDRGLAEEVARASVCYHELISALLASGYIPYRASPASFPLLRRHGSTYWDVTAELKRALDPQGLLSPGRYVPAPGG